MSGYLADRIEKPKHFCIAPLKQGRGSRASKVIGFDTEATNGRPFLLQINAWGGVDDTQLRPLDPNDGLACIRELVRFVHEFCTNKDTEYTIVGWNLTYEYTQLFGHHDTEAFRELRVNDEFSFTFELRDGSGNLLAEYFITVWASKRRAITIRNNTTHRNVRVIDGMAYYVTGLNKAASMLDIGAKLAVCGAEHPYDMKCAACEYRIANLSPADLGDPVFIAYAKQDAYLTRRIGETIIGLHEEYDVTTCISAPQFASKVFRRHFLKDEIPLADRLLEQAGLYSYHGGKNGYYLPKPMELVNIYQYDITSAYPEAMRQLPDPSLSVWEFVHDGGPSGNAYTPGKHALWCISGEYRPCKYRCMLTHSDGFAVSGSFDNLWVTGYELDSMIEHGEIEVSSCIGFILSGPEGSGPFVDYVDTFFSMKRDAIDLTIRNTAKLLLNALYGKLIQKVKLTKAAEFIVDLETETVVYTEPDGSDLFDYRAGGLYHPPLASLVTGFVRAKIHRLEHKYDALMTSTDGFFAKRVPDPTDIGKHLGGLTVDQGTLKIWRERLYAFRVDGKWSKFALHGFRGTLKELLRMPLDAGIYAYRARQMVTLKLSQHERDGQRYEPGMFADLPFRLDLSTKSDPSP